MESFDLIVTGSGPAGYAAAIRGAALGARVALVERDALGGTCVNRGCIPTKFMMEAAETAAAIGRSGTFGLRASLESVDLKGIKERKNALIETLGEGMVAMLEMAGIRVIRGSSCFTSPQTLIVTDPEGEKAEITSPKTIIATGASFAPIRVPGLKNDEMLTTEKAFALEKLPESVVIVGGDAIALEWSCLFNALGSQVTVVEGGSHIAPGEDVEMSALFMEALEQTGISFEVGAKVERAHVDEEGDKHLQISDGRQIRQITAQEVFVVPERIPNTENLGLDVAGVTVRDGVILVDDKMETNVDGIYAAGDVAGGRMLSHVASAQGQVAADNALGRHRWFGRQTVPRCVYTMPQFAAVGLTEEEAQRNGREVKIGTASLAMNARAATIARREGVIKVIADARHGDILGVHIVGALATETIAQAVLAMSLECTVGDFSRVLQAHPTLAEALVEAIKAAK
ncbi:MAG: dihydrolipoyl dehydrogenase [Chloroflexi bacterium]|nr:dihydrolipoyl dehydrogenase [Chloroflexota bacterium]MDA8189387.1 dihydrolipoyl dehydrogenase [Dehalococcoidales bacterium]